MVAPRSLAKAVLLQPGCFQILQIDEAGGDGKRSFELAGCAEKLDHLGDAGYVDLALPGASRALVPLWRSENSTKPFD
jgi:hypothetical protein